MVILSSIVVLLASLYVLARSANLTVAHIVRIAHYFNISEALIGVSVLSVSTSLPEISIAVMAALSGSPSISVGNVLGSSITDLCLVIGVGVLLAGHVKLTRRGLRQTVGLLAIVSIIPLVLVMIKRLNLITGVILLGIFAAYTLSMIRKEHTTAMVAHHAVPSVCIPRSLSFFIVGIAGVLIASKVVVDSALNLTAATGLSNTLIGATVVSLGTCLPELTIDITALRKKHVELALGDAIGSCLTNLTIVFGLLGILSPVGINVHEVMFPALFLVIAAIASWYMFEFKREITIKNAVVLILMYVAFVVLEVVNSVWMPFV